MPLCLERRCPYLLRDKNHSPGRYKVAACSVLFVDNIQPRKAMAVGSKPGRPTSAAVSIGAAGQWLARLFSQLWGERHAAPYRLAPPEVVGILAQGGAQ